MCPNDSSGAFMSIVQYFARGEPFDEGRDLLLVEGLENIVSQAVPEENLSTTPSETRAPFEVENALEFEYATCKLIKEGRLGEDVYKNALGSMCEDMFCTDPGLNQHLISNEGSAMISRFFDQDGWETGA
mmetsp:Transcript_10130/g.41794  ORF Transcript_10130/g.41794 Transcript_10130/m.41794 type:complete len:130 (-) Transcript_10130:2607-2996(-)